VPASDAAGPAADRPRFDAELYKQSNVVERSYNVSKQWRALGTRYDKHAVIYRGVAVLRSIIIWLKALGDMPQALMPS